MSKDKFNESINKANIVLGKIPNYCIRNNEEFGNFKISKSNIMESMNNGIKILKSMKSQSIDPNIHLYEETWRSDIPESSDIEVKICKNNSNDYIGNEETGRLLSEIGISPELIDDTHNVCSIGFCEVDNKWYGWSHRCMSGFGIDDMIFDPELLNDLNDDGHWEDVPFNQVGTKPIKTMENAKQAAINFAGYIG